MPAIPRWTPKTPISASLALALALALLSGCAQPPVQVSRQADDCAALFAARDRVSASSHDAQYHPLAGFYGLRSDRVLALVGFSAHSREQRQLWLQRLAEHDLEASNIELANSRNAAAQSWRSPSQQQQLSNCRDQQQQQLLDDPTAFTRALTAAQVPDAYQDWARAVGVYPLFEALMKPLISHAQAAAAQRPAPLDSPQWLGYQPLTASLATDTTASVDALGLPQVTAAQAAALFARHAPWLKVAQASRADRLGSPTLTTSGQGDFAQQNPQVFEQLGWSQLNGRWHLQLIYQFWFSQRPAMQPLDLYAGELDGLLWRVTLDAQGQALLYDSIHPCGCWQEFFLPAHSPLQARAPQSLASDLELRPLRILSSQPHTAPTLWLSSGEHSLLWVDAHRSRYPGISYQQSPLSDLRQLRQGQLQGSLYAANGLIEGTQRLERWLLWPSGVLQPGSMRQWGQHATAFVGRAHFDDPQLLARYFNAP